MDERRTRRRDDERIVTIARYDQAAPAHIDCGRLEAAGIAAMVANDNQPGLTVFHAVVGGSVDLQVFERDADEALALLREVHAAASGDDADGSAGAPGCPRCGAEALQPADPPPGFGASSRSVAIVAALAGAIALAVLVHVAFSMLVLLPVLIFRLRRGQWRRCTACGELSRDMRSRAGAPGTRVWRGSGPRY